MRNPHKVTTEFEEMLCEYTGAPYCVTVDNQSNGIFLSLMYQKKTNPLTNISIPSHTYMSVPCEIIHAGLKVNFEESNKVLVGAYELKGTFPVVIDSALRFTANMYKPNTLMCLSFTGPYKHLKLIKGGAILTDSKDAYKWLKKARFSGRDECSYHVDDFDKNPVIGWNMYMMPDVAARGILLMNQFYDSKGNKKHNEDLRLEYPDLSKFKLWK